VRGVLFASETGNSLNMEKGMAHLMQRYADGAAEKDFGSGKPGYQSGGKLRERLAGLALVFDRSLILEKVEPGGGKTKLILLRRIVGVRPVVTVVPALFHRERDLVLEAQRGEQGIEFFQDLASLEPEIDLLVSRLHILDADLAVVQLRGCLCERHHRTDGHAANAHCQDRSDCNAFHVSHP